MENNVIIDEITKEQFEGWIDEGNFDKTILSDSQWKAIKEEIEARINLYIDGLLEDVIQDIREGFYDENN